MALSGHFNFGHGCPLSDRSGRSWILAWDGLSAYDPKRTSLRGVAALFREIAARNTKCEIAHTPLKRNSLKLIVWATARGRPMASGNAHLLVFLDVIDGDTGTIHWAEQGERARASQGRPDT